jgi:hypothetical protein
LLIHYTSIMLDVILLYEVYWLYTMFLVLAVIDGLVVCVLAYSDHHQIACHKAMERLHPPYHGSKSTVQCCYNTFAMLRVLSCVHSPGLCCSCFSVVRFCCDREACNLVMVTIILGLFISDTINIKIKTQKASNFKLNSCLQQSVLLSTDDIKRVRFLISGNSVSSFRLTAGLL